MSAGAAKSSEAENTPMSTIRIKGDKNPYDVKNRLCIGRPCLKLHPIQIRGATSSGSRFVGYRYGCGTRDYNGCPPTSPQLRQKTRRPEKKGRPQ